MDIASIGIGRWGQLLTQSFSEKCNIKYFSSTGNSHNIKLINDIVPSAEHVDIKHILEDEKVDAVIVAVPMEQLYDIAQRVLEAKKHLFLEKPGATSFKDIDMLRTVLNKNQVCHIGYGYLRDPNYIKFKDMIRTSKARVDNLSLLWKKWGTFENDILLNLASHDIAIAHDLLGNELVIETVKVTKNTCQLQLKTQKTNVIIKIDRQSRIKDKKITLTIKDSDFYIFPPNNLIDLQRNRFLNSIEMGEDTDDLELASNVLNTIEEIRACV